MGWGKGTIIATADGGNTLLAGTAKIKEVADMALSDGHHTIQEIEQMEEILAHNWERMERLEREDAEACSEERAFTDDEGTLWKYVTVHDEYVRIIGCETAVEALDIPATIEDMPVIELATDACSRLESVKSIVCSPQIEKIGKCAFRECRALESIVFPHNTTEYDSSWVRNCDHLGEMTLPGMLERITPDIFDVGNVHVLTIGEKTHEFIANPFAKGKICELFIDEKNPYIKTDGQAILSLDGTRLVALAVECERYEIPAGCEVIANKAFANRTQLKDVVLSDTITVLEDYAFSYSGIEQFIAPSSLRSIGERAFFRCRALAEVILNEGLVFIGEEAFTGTAITALRVPATLDHLGMNVADKTALTYAGEDAGFSIAPNGILELDEAGGLYRNAEDGRHFVRMLDDSLETYAIEPGTVEIEPFAFTRNEVIREVTLSEGLLRIGKGAFRGARKLAIADFPSTLLEVGDEAFLDTSLSRVNIPKDLERIGEIALITYGAHNGDRAPALTEIEADPQNERFYAVPGLLIERHEDGTSHIIAYADSVESITVPEDVTVIEQYAFSGARNLKELFISNRVRQVKIRGLSIDCLIEHLHIDLKEPIEGHEFFDLHYPVTERSAHEQQLAFNLSSSVHLQNILKHYDSAIMNMHAFDKRSAGEDDEVDVYLQAKLAIDRLVDPIMMTSTNATMLSQMLKENIIEICEVISRHDDRKAIDDLLELGFLNKDNLLDVIDRVTKLQDAAMTAYLLEIKRMLFQRSAIDFDL